MHWFYSAALAVGLVLGLPYWAWQAARHGKYRAGLGERLGLVPERLGVTGRVIWLHAVSVGEVLAVSGLIAELKRRLPEHRILISTTTDTGQKLARAKFGVENVFYFPLDFGFAVRPYLQKLKPELVVLAETEFWPNFLRLAHASGVHVAVVNARISDRSLPGYRRWSWIFGSALRRVDLLLAQSDEDSKRLVEIGAPAERVLTAGNLKFDVPHASVPKIVGQVKAAVAGTGPILVCGSTVEGEEPLLLGAFRDVLAQNASAVMVLAPRHPERFQEVAELLQKSGVRFWRRSEWKGEALGGGVLLLDSIGELAAVYALADIAFVGGSLVPRGGHNILEPAQHGVAIVVGEHTENFRDIVDLFKAGDAVRVVGTGELSSGLSELMSNSEKRLALGQRAAETVRSQTGATERTVDALLGLLRHGSKSL